jgi:DNA repair exonuclease SbcCD ATPase subunit
MRYKGGRKGFEVNYFCCRHERKESIKQCTNHSIRVDSLESIVLEELQNLFDYVKNRRTDFIEQISKKSNKAAEQNLKAKTAEFNKSEKRVAELEQLIRKTFESNALGKLSDERFAVLLSDYEDEQKDLKSRITELRTELDTAKAQSHDFDRFLKAMDKYTEVTELNTEILHTFIENIIIGEPVKAYRNGKTLSQDVTIIFNCIGEWHSPVVFDKN